MFSKEKTSGDVMPCTTLFLDYPAAVHYSIVFYTLIREQHNETYTIETLS
jgi:hypothetical protein